jgi:hypothetical protein
MVQTAVLVISDGIHTEQWLGPLAALTSSASDYRRADLPLLPSARVFSSRAVGFTCHQIWYSYTHGVLYEEVLFFKPRLLSEVIKNFGRFEDTLERSPHWRPLRPYTKEERVDRVQLELLVQSELAHL